MPVTARFRTAAGSDPGRKRGNNEDRYLADPVHGIFAVVDGMGGQAAGEQAAEIAVNMLRARLERRTGGTEERIREAITVANNDIHEAARQNPAWQGMACVLTVTVVENSRLTFGHVGDSRLYLLQPGQIRKITHDHSPIGEREDHGELAERDAMRHPRRNEVYRDVGSAPHRPDDPEFIETGEVPFPPDAALLLCSDGLSDLVPSAEIRRIVEAHAGDPDRGAQALIDAANAAGGKDNITVVLVEGPAYAAAPVAAPAPAERRRPLTGRWAFLVYGALLGLLLVWAARPWLERFDQGAHPAPPPPRTWHVGPTETSDGATISRVLEKARPGDTVVVAPGTYRELVRLPGGVTLLSRDAHAAVLHATDRGIAVLADGAQGARLAGFRIAGDPQHPMTIGVQVRDSPVTLDYLVISGATTAGIEILGEARPRVQSCQIVNNPGAGVVVRDAASPRLAHNLIAGNGKAPRAARPGLEILGTATPALVGNAFVDNGAEAIWAPRPGPDPGVLAQNYFGYAEKGTPRRKVRVIPQ